MRLRLNVFTCWFLARSSLMFIFRSSVSFMTRLFWLRSIRVRLLLPPLRSWFAPVCPCILSAALLLRLLLRIGRSCPACPLRNGRLFPGVMVGIKFLKIWRFKVSRFVGYSRDCQDTAFLSSAYSALLLAALWFCPDQLPLSPAVSLWVAAVLAPGSMVAACYSVYFDHMAALEDTEKGGA